MVLRMGTHLQLHLTSQQRKQLDKLIRTGAAKARTLTKARILLLTDRSQGTHHSDDQIASALGVSVRNIVRALCRQD